MTGPDYVTREGVRMKRTKTIEMPRPPVPEGFPSCRECGCWEYDACWDEDAGPCWWVESDLCSHCCEPIPQLIGAHDPDVLTL